MLNLDIAVASAMSHVINGAGSYGVGHGTQLLGPNCNETDITERYVVLWLIVREPQLPCWTLVGPALQSGDRTSDLTDLVADCALHCRGRHLP